MGSFRGGDFIQEGLGPRGFRPGVFEGFATLALVFSWLGVVAAGFLSVRTVGVIIMKNQLGFKIKVSAKIKKTYPEVKSLAGNFGIFWDCQDG